jgi:hypothetical protein
LDRAAATRWPFCEVGEEEPPPPPGGDEPRRGLRQLQLAIETDYEFFQLFGNLNDTGAYVVELYGACERHLHARDQRAH